MLTCLGRQTVIVYIAHLNTARNSQTKKPSVTLSAAPRNLPSLFIDATSIIVDLAGALPSTLFFLFREQSRQLVRCALGPLFPNIHSGTYWEHPLSVFGRDAILRIQTAALARGLNGL